MRTAQTPILSQNRPRTTPQPQTRVPTTTERTFKAAEEAKGTLQNYVLGREIGRGAYSTVRLATFKATKEPVAIKSYDKFKITDVRKRSNIRREIKIMHLLRHPNTIKILETFETGREINIVMEYVGLNSLQSQLKKRTIMKYPEEEAKHIFKQIVDGVHYCHSMNIAHRDLKLDNVILDQGRQVKIIDFGFATCEREERKTRTFCGTPSYMAPEIIKKQEYLGRPVDVWALGVLLYAMLCGVYPFRGRTDRELYQNISKGSFYLPAGLSQEAAELLSLMLSVDPTRRPSCREILSQPWLII